MLGKLFAVIIIAVLLPFLWWIILPIIGLYVLGCAIEAVLS